MTYFWIFLVGGILLIWLVSSAIGSSSSSNEPVQSFDLKKKQTPQPIKKYTPTPPLTPSKTTTSDDLRGDFTPKQVRGLTSQQKEILKSLIGNRWLKSFDSCKGAILPVVGNMYRSDAAQEVYSTLLPGDRVTIMREPDNEFDETAVKVMAKRCKIGYIPEEYSSQIYWHIGLRLVAGCCVCTPSDGNCGGLEIVIFIKEQTDEENEE